MVKSEHVVVGHRALPVQEAEENYQSKTTLKLKGTFPVLTLFRLGFFEFLRRGGGGGTFYRSRKVFTLL